MLGLYQMWLVACFCYTETSQKARKTLFLHYLLTTYSERDGMRANYAFLFCFCLITIFESFYRRALDWVCLLTSSKFGGKSGEFEKAQRDRSAGLRNRM